MAESTSVSMRPFVAAINNMFCQIGHMMIALLVYLEPDMEKMEMMNGLFGLIFIPLWIMLPESPRWLLAKGRQDQANHVIKGLLFSMETKYIPVTLHNFRVCA